MKHFLILETGRPIGQLRRHGSFGHWIRVAAGLAGREVRAFQIADGEALPDAGEFAGVLVTGSGEVGTVPVQLHANAADDPLFAGLPASIDAQTTHLQSVISAPPGATVLARLDKDACQAFRWGQSAWGVQFHPEFSADLMRGYIDARRVLKRFVHQARNRANAKESR